MPGLRIVWHGLTAVAVLGLACLVAQAKDGSRSTAAKSGTDKAFLAAKKEFQKRIHNKKSDERIAALKLLADFPTGEAADLVYVSLLDDRAVEVRDAAVDYLAAWRDRSDVNEKLLQRMTNSSRKDGMDIRAIGALRALGGTEDEALQFRLIAYLIDFLGARQSAR